MRGLRRSLLSIVLLAGGSGAGVAGTVDTAECRRDLIVLESDLKTAQTQLAKVQDAPRAELCAAWRQQIATFKKAAATYRRCKTGTDQRVLSSQMDSQALDFQSAIDQMCKGR